MRGAACGIAVLTCMAVAPGAALGAEGGQGLRAGVAAVDATWHVGASAGQYASDGFFIDAASGNFDPTVHSYRRAPSYGVQSRLSVRALVVEGADGQRLAIVKNDQYIPQDLVYRRAAQLLEQEGSCGIDAEHLTMASTHNHSSPMYSSSSWGVWAFQDVIDVRFFNYLAERMYMAVEAACEKLVPVRVGAAVGRFDKTPRHSIGPAVADDGTPAGYPYANVDRDLTVIRFDDVSGPGRPKPLANLVNYSLHPEFLEGNDLISADYLGPVQRLTDRATGALTIWTQGAVGTSEPERSTHHSVHERLELTHRDYAQAEYAAGLMSDAIVGVWDDIGRGHSTVTDPERFVRFRRRMPVAIVDRWYPGPFSHPYPGVSNCRTDKGLAGNPQLPIVGLPDCTGVLGGLGSLSDLVGLPAPPDIDPGIDPGLSTDDFQAVGIPVPENYGAPAYTGLEEDIDVHLQAIRLGDILLTVCSCEQWLDQSRNIETRTDRVVGNEWVGYNWGAQCRRAGDGTYRIDGSGTGSWNCPNPSDPSALLEPIGDRGYARMRAQVNNAANGWNNAEYALVAESEPVDPQRIRGNYTHDDRCGTDRLTPGDRPCRGGGVPVSARLGYTLTVPISMANDYNGYIATYREYQRGDHYRKALTGWGPHSSDYIATRLVTMGRQLQAPGLVLPRDQQQEWVLALKAAADTGLNELRATALGEVGAAATAAFEGLLPDDPAPMAVEQPGDIERFDAALFTWSGGSNFTDNPVVTVQRWVRGRWRYYAGQQGELPVTLDFPALGDVPAYLSGGQEWNWTAHFEAFVAPFDVGGPRATPAGAYRFTVGGMRRQGGVAVPYALSSKRFRVRAWQGITVSAMRLGDDRRVSFRVGPRSTYTVGGEDSEVEVERGAEGTEMTAHVGPIDYPDSYESPARFVRDQRTAFVDPEAPHDPGAIEWFCFTCSFRPWVDAGEAVGVVVTVVGPGGTRGMPARRVGGRWVSEGRLQRGERAFVAVGAVRDRWGNFNGVRSEVVR